MADLSLGQAAYEKYASLFGDRDRKPPWDKLRPPVQKRWEAIAGAVFLGDVGSADSLAQAAYEAYWKARNASESRRPWTVMTAWERAAWEAAATAVLETCGGGS